MDEFGITNHDTYPKDFGHYKILCKLGEGGMGKVYKAFDTRLKRTIAIKTLTAKGFNNSKQVSRFAIEAQAMAKLNHPNIIRVYEIGEWHGVHFLTMDYIDGCSLKELMKKNSLRKSVQLMIAVAEAMEYAHNRGIVHRDLKPSNIMVSTAGIPYIMDFGLAKLLDSNQELSKTGMVMGTIIYMPPEQAEGKHRLIDRRSDVYSLGVILYQLATGVVPFRGNSSLVLLAEITQKKPSLPSSLNRRVNKELDQICMKAMEKKKENRYESAQKFADDLKAYMDGKKVPERKKSLPKIYVALILFLVFVALIFVLREDPWNNYQNRMKADFDAISQNEKDTEIWKNFLIQFAKDNPNTSEDNYMREIAEKSIVQIELAKNESTTQDATTPETTKSESENATQGNESTTQDATTPEDKNIWHDIPQNWSKSMWQECWNGEWLDFTKALWGELDTSRQIELTRSYKSWYTKRMPFEMRILVFDNDVKVEDAKIKLGFKLVPPGKFWMGAGTTKRKVLIEKPFYMLRKEVTQIVWTTLMGNNPSMYKDDFGPVEQVNWHQGLDFCNKLQSYNPQWEFKLPNKEEWEYACRAGTTSSYYWGNNWDRTIVNSASYWAQADIMTYEDKKKFPFFNSAKPLAILHNEAPENAFGLHAMHGNVAEWCLDEDVTKKKRVVRGGSFLSSAYECTSYASFNLSSKVKKHYVGLRPLFRIK